MYLLGHEIAFSRVAVCPTPISLNDVVHQSIPSVTVALTYPSAPTTPSHDDDTIIDKIAGVASFWVVGYVCRMQPDPYHTWTTISYMNMKLFFWAERYLGKLNAHISPGI